MNWYHHIAAWGFPVCFFLLVLALGMPGDESGFHRAGFEEGWNACDDENEKDLERLYTQRGEATSLAAKHSLTLDKVYAIIKDRDDQIANDIKEILK